MVYSDVRDLSKYRDDKDTSKVTTISTPSKIQAKIIEATGFIRNSQGEIQLIASESKNFLNKHLSTVVANINKQIECDVLGKKIINIKVCK